MTNKQIEERINNMPLLTAAVELVEVGYNKEEVENLYKEGRELTIKIRLYQEMVK